MAASLRCLMLTSSDIVNVFGAVIGMPDDERRRREQSALPSRTRQIEQFTMHRNRLSVMPLAVLLPPVGDLSQLDRLGSSLARRLETLQAGNLTHAEDEAGQGELRLFEKSMLTQVLQWLSVGTTGAEE